jgi:hypothetical protein
MPVDTKELLVQIDASVKALADLIEETRRRSDAARDADDPDAGRALDALGARYAQQRSDLIEQKIAEIDNSAEMQDLIKDFSDINQKIEDQLKIIADVKKFINIAAKVADGFDKVIGLALKGLP